MLFGVVVLDGPVNMALNESSPTVPHPTPAPLITEMMFQKISKHTQCVHPPHMVGKFSKKPM